MAYQLDGVDWLIWVGLGRAFRRAPRWETKILHYKKLQVYEAGTGQKFKTYPIGKEMSTQISPHGAQASGVPLWGTIELLERTPDFSSATPSLHRTYLADVELQPDVRVNATVLRLS